MWTNQLECVNIYTQYALHYNLKKTSSKDAIYWSLYINNFVISMINWHIICYKHESINWHVICYKHDKLT